MTKNKNKKSSEAAKQEAFKLSDGICYCKTPENSFNRKTDISDINDVYKPLRDMPEL